jgi:hypothetical protein
MAFLARYTPLHNLATHSMDKTVQTFHSETGKGKTINVNQKYNRWSIGLLLQAYWVVQKKNIF